MTAGRCKECGRRTKQGADVCTVCVRDTPHWGTCVKCGNRTRRMAAICSRCRERGASSPHARVKWRRCKRCCKRCSVLLTTRHCNDCGKQHGLPGGRGLCT